ncbi:MAG: gliding motility-associated C-terminal domain-containing protein [Bacteroidia bacterium]|nr:gliding motility-associated C-terminal domain-containing protein [Bacteroidia bacterium]
MSAGINRIILFITILIFYNLSASSQTTVMSENFEHGGALPSGWTNQFVSGSVNWICATGGSASHPAAAHNGAYNGLFYSANYNGNKTKLITSAINLGSYSYCVLDFYHAQVNWAGDCDTLKVYYKTSAGGAWTLIQTFSGQVIDWKHRTIVLPNPSATYYLGFEGISDYGYGVCIDDVIVTGYPTYLLNSANNNTTVTTCGAIVFDSGGPGGNYANSESYTMTFTSNNGGCIRAVLQYYNTEMNYDFLYFYDGTSTAAPQIGETVHASPGEIVSTIDKTGNAYYALSGSITIKFTSDNLTVDAGFKLKIDCPENCVAPSCTGTIPAADNCESTTSICDFNGYCGSTDSIIYTTDHDEIDSYHSGIFCGGINNNSWLSFVAESNEAVLDVWVSDCQGSFYGTVKGIQLEVFDTDCNTFIAKSNCWSPSEQINGQITATGLIPGHTYLLMIDGYAKDNCKYVFAASQGLLVADAGKDQTICEGDWVQLVASGGTSVTWSASPSDPGLAGQENDFTIWVSPSQTTTYTATVTGSNPACPGNADVTVYVDAANASFTGLAPSYCINGSSATLTGNYAPNGIFSGAGVTGTTFNPSSAGAGTHDVTYTFDYQVVTKFEDDFDPAPVAGWTHGATGTDSWATGKPKGGNGSNSNPNSNKDPLIDHTSNTDNNVYGQGLSAGTGNGVGGYNNSSTEWLKTPVIDCSTIRNSTLSFWRYANFEPSYDEAYVKISTDGTTWTTLPEPDYPQDNHWTQRIINISQWADGHSTVYIRWISVSDGSQTYSGWNIDDVRITGVQYQISGLCTSTDVQSTIVYPMSVAGTASTPPPICAGSAATISLTGYTGSIQWQQSPNGTSGWANVTGGSGSTSASYTTAALTTTTYYRAVITSGAGCTSANSTTVSVTVTPQSVGGTATATNNTLCYNTSTTLSLTGSSGNIQWQQSPDGSTWSDIPGATSSTYTTSNLTATTYFRAVLSSAGCTPAYSNTIVITVYPNLTPGTIAANQTLCANATPAGLTQITAPAGGTGSYTYQWQSSTDNINWYNITGATNSNYSPPQLAITTYYRRNVTSGGCGTVNSNTVTITVNANPVAEAGNNATIPNGTNTALNGSASGGTGNYSYNWSPAGLLQNPNVQNPQTVNLSSTTVYTLTVTDINSGCTGTDQVTVYITGGPLSIIATATDYSICKGTQALLHAVGSGGNPAGYQYTWTSNSSSFTSGSANPADYPTVNTIYTVVLFDGSNTVSDTVTVTVYTLPVAEAGNNASICNGISTTLSGSGSSGFPTLTYTWSNGLGSGMTQTVTPTSTTTYTLTVTDGHGCTQTDQVTVTVNALPAQFTVSGGGAYCAGGTGVTINLSGSEIGVNYQLQLNGVNTGIAVAGTGAAISWNNQSAAGAYTVVATNASTPCTINMLLSATITVNPAPGPQIYGDVDACQGEMLNYYTTNIAGHSYSWTITGGTPATSVSSSVDITWGNISPGMITLTETIDATGCSATTNSFAVIIHSAPVADAGSNDTICYGGSVVLSAANSTGSAPLGYAWNNGLGSGVSHTVTPNVPTTYIVTVTDNYGCTATDQVTILVNPMPVVDAGNNVSICSGNSATIVATPVSGTLPFTYTWDNGLGSGISHNVSPTVTTMYHVSVVDAKQCTGIDSVIVIVYPSPVANAGADDTICKGENISVDASSSSGVQPLTYSWNNNLGSGAVHTVSPVVTTFYYLTVTDANLCYDFDTIIISVNPLPVAEAGADSIICSGSSTVIDATGSTGLTPLTYHWNNVAIDSLATQNVTPEVTTTFTVTVTDINGCSKSDSVKITVAANPVANAGQDVSVCRGTAVSLDASGSSGTAPLNYLWNNSLGSGSTHSITPDSSKTYIVTVSDAVNCSDIDTVIVTVKAVPAFSIQSTNTTCTGNKDGTATIVIISATQPVLYIWSTGETVSNLVNLGAGNYSITVTDSTGCQKVSSVEIKDAVDVSCIEIPSAFTPNGDGKNDKWEIRHIDLYPEAQVEIYNRWGLLLFKSDNYSNPDNWWDGKYNGKDVATGSYIYIIKLRSDSEPIQGIVTVIR